MEFSPAPAPGSNTYVKKASIKPSSPSQSRRIQDVLLLPEILTRLFHSVALTTLCWIVPPRWSRLDGKRAEAGVKGPAGNIFTCRTACVASPSPVCIPGLWSSLALNQALSWNAVGIPRDDGFPHCCPRQFAVLVVAVGDCGSLPAFAARLNVATAAFSCICVYLYSPCKNESCLVLVNI